MKTFEEFSKNYEQIRKNTTKSPEEIDEVIKRHYEKYENDHFNEWRNKLDVDTINKIGLKNLREIWEAIDYCDK